ncbi:MAG TPA: glycosyltransferase family 39 protein [Gaiellaceae bacterium]|nr:glycosyltransferase family 39 protein [Gaiellaceae bacterium]
MSTLATAGRDRWWASERIGHWVPLAAIVAVAAALRLSTLGLQSYDFDEAFTVKAIDGSFAGMLHAVARNESTPPLYYTVAWLWARVFGTGEAGLRLLSALAGIVTVPVVYAAGRLASDRRLGLVAALIAATSPYLVFYSQEARAYALFTLLTILSVVCCLRAIAAPSPRAIAWWSLSIAAAIATHYFAIFFWLGQLGTLVVFGAPRRLLAWSSVAVGVVCTPLLVLAAHQARAGHVDWIGASSLPQRLRVMVETFALGATFMGTLPRSVLAVCGVLAVVMAAAIVTSLGFLLRRSDARERRPAAIAGLVAVIAVILPLVAALAGKDYVINKNLIPVVPLLALVFAAGLACRKAGRTGMLATAVLALAGLVLTIMSFVVADMRRPDVRQVSNELGRARRGRVVIFIPRWQVLFEHYQPSAHSLPNGGARVGEIDVFTTSSSLPPGTVPKEFALTRVRHGDTFNLFRFRSRTPVVVRPAHLARRTFSESGLTPIAVVENGAQPQVVNG